MTDYVTFDNFYLAVGMDSTDATRDPLIASAISAASRMIDNETGRSFTLDESVSQRTYTPSPCDDLLIVDDIGDLTGLVVESGYFGSDSWQTLTNSTDFEVSPINAISKGKPVTSLVRPIGWGYSPLGRVRVTAKWGWPSIPDEVVQACLIQAVRLFKRKDSPEGVLGATDFGFTRVSKMDPDVMNLISHLVIPGFGG
jgi:hypothetical protein